MLNSIITGTEITTSAFFICTAVSLALGLAAAALSMFKAKSRYSQSYILTLAMLPALVQIVIMMVNGNIGAGVAVAGAFGLIRFRSAPGSAKEIGMVFLATAIGLATGMGYVAIAAVFFAIIAAFSLLLTALGFGAGAAEERELRITIPENLDYEGLFDDLFQKYTRSTELKRVKTASMGTLYELRYQLVLREGVSIKSFLDELRERNGNLSISCGKPVEKAAL
ncbi:MAG: DUF4956 domain-containing protein [Oscillospiraceae bacterium]|nr:DUF4956 domain-containing protein [Oscillospiraceae bacterium]MBQ2632993.1 DUF4956 domain-containing protein [Oscillospiraceae bacterium]MBR3860798.1 DUF4956 domain-containing protein [Oscillospiraceae bacterium]MBR7056871.1 DUF4956 domain-containing protein [Oscillospiraceae bacterium]